MEADNHNPGEFGEFDCKSVCVRVRTHARMKPWPNRLTKLTHSWIHSGQWGIPAVSFKTAKLTLAGNPIKRSADTPNSARGGRTARLAIGFDIGGRMLGYFAWCVLVGKRWVVATSETPRDVPRRKMWVTV